MAQHVDTLHSRMEGRFGDEYGLKKNENGTTTSDAPCLNFFTPFAAPVFGLKNK